MSTIKAGTDRPTDISEKLDIIIGFLAIRGMQDDAGAMIERLRGLGLNAKATARVTGLTENAIAIRLSRMKKKTT
jgi:hypothetical protein